MNKVNKNLEKLSIVFSFLLSSFFCFKFFSMAFFGFEESPILAVLKLTLPCTLSALIIGFFAHEKWKYASILGMVPGFLIFLMMLQGILVEGNIDEIYWFSFPLGIMISFSLFVFLGYKIRMVMKTK